MTTGTPSIRQGHRQRLRARFLRDSGESMEDYEILELILMESIKRQDVKPVAHALMKKYGSISEVLAATPEMLTQTKGIGEASIVSLKLVESAMQRSAKQHTLGVHVISSWETLLEYCRTSFGSLSNEEFHAVVLNQQHNITGHVMLGKGSIADVMIQPREVVKRVLEHHASSIVLVHNHPSGSPKPSGNDVKTTMKLRAALKAVDVFLFDHLIVARGGEITSFKNKGLL